ncbi:EKC/KEOPS complex subunit Gon7 [Penicillium concentricum]|uniref:EKC/KEOPS complex subunit GON7 n=1 Tax=Penicillium concentricum TaxID=293559 RepID=A0A9W9VBU7_9EURO|nr:EKC/KEOPS complex subunit Gon7 [Penicillium concentricum]KAJ5373691.1 EKC/KEOPS complex subunit Gon7 [Penicillium concentricum]
MASNTSLNAVYTAPQSTETFEHVFSTTTGTLAAKQAHLSELQLLVPKLQDQINAFLTERMEEDKKVQGKLSAQEAKEEENYGEEVVEDDA